ncbi:unnamed protein product [Vitrella brassicaformis CCMP3155]|uniref:Uncharacterized protein n=1 Tax=Vitrella brassicaformis (strain CCMP3155) TaxID=1169540 RepID=A0A0G4EW17_VITBC|nr:unnamed protein product [Vitrella brassicaformis CCMP3155]|eukprot:CEM02632.1 unnamed protein product [Vitrella brassicaformis CCMP3155]
MAQVFRPSSERREGGSFWTDRRWQSKKAQLGATGSKRQSAASDGKVRAQEGAHHSSRGRQMRLRQCCTRRTDLPLLLLTMAAYSDALSDAGQSSAFTAVDMEMIQKQMEDQQSSSMTSGSSETSTRRRGTDGSDAARRVIYDGHWKDDARHGQGKAYY